uniref:Uncharacterized protein n=1 Tax=Rousettus aegyptiacus TaxID=9407 RepID=A0A7J8IL54_ROUAE|nr:hypothetical protein HJG63_010545 [Rousettus aegyptiacus]
MLVLLGDSCIFVSSVTYRVLTIYNFLSSAQTALLSSRARPPRRHLQSIVPTLIYLSIISSSLADLLLISCSSCMSERHRPRSLPTRKLYPSGVLFLFANPVATWRRREKLLWQNTHSIYHVNHF